MNDPAQEYHDFKAFALSQHPPLKPMSELTQNTINFCRHHAPFRTVEMGRARDRVFVKDRLGLIIASCPRIDDAWTIVEALNHVAGSTGAPPVVADAPSETGSRGAREPAPGAGALPEKA